MAAQQQRSKHFKINPVELGIFSLVSLVFLNSLYNLFYDRRGFHPAIVEQMASAKNGTEGRSPASLSPLFLNYDFKCDGQASNQATAASKVRFTGPLCGVSAPAESVKLLKTQITNTSNHFAATVFTDPSDLKFSTDYIPLNAGSNAIHVEFTYQNGKVLSQDIQITKN